MSRWMPTIALAAGLALAGCGGGDGCSGFFSVNASPERCRELAEEFGCEGFEPSEGPSCGLIACARCEGDE